MVIETNAFNKELLFIYFFFILSKFIKKKADLKIFPGYPYLEHQGSRFTWKSSIFGALS